MVSMPEYKKINNKNCSKQVSFFIQHQSASEIILLLKTNGIKISLHITANQTAIMI